MEITLPWPPSVNHYWRHVGNRTLLSKRGREYRKEVALDVLHWRASFKAFRGYGWEQFTGNVEVCIVAHAPTKRRYDIDNLPKAILDALEHAGVFDDDSQVAKLTIERGDVVRGGNVHVTVATQREE